MIEYVSYMHTCYSGTDMMLGGGEMRLCMHIKKKVMIKSTTAVQAKDTKKLQAMLHGYAVQLVKLVKTTH